MATLKAMIAERATVEMTAVNARLATELTNKERITWTTYRSEIAWILNEGFKSRTAAQINGEMGRLAKAMQGREPWTEAYQTALIRMNAICAVMNWDVTERNQRIQGIIPFMGYTERSVLMVSNELTACLPADRFLSKDGRDVFRAVMQQDAVCPWCHKVNSNFDLRYVKGTDSNGKDVSGQAYPFAAELPELKVTCPHYKYACAGPFPNNFMIFAGRVEETPEYLEKQRKAQDEWAAIERELGISN